MTAKNPRRLVVAFVKLAAVAVVATGCGASHLEYTGKVSDCDNDVLKDHDAVLVLDIDNQGDVRGWFGANLSQGLLDDVYSAEKTDDLEIDESALTFATTLQGDSDIDVDADLEADGDDRYSGDLAYNFSGTKLKCSLELRLDD